MLHRAATLNDLRVPPANRLEALKAERKRQHSNRINDTFGAFLQWPICFEWREDGIYEVEMAKMDLADRLEKEVKVFATA